MKRYLIFVILAALVFYASGVQAGKPRPTPTPDPYLPPVEAQAYPEPTYEPQLPEADPRPGVPYTWGYFGGAWWVTIDGVGWQPGYAGEVCVMRSGSGIYRCYTLTWISYEGGDRNWYRSPYVCTDGEWYVYYAALNNIVADIRQPNVYMIRCRFAPGIRAMR